MIVGRDGEVLGDRIGVVSLQDPLQAVVETAVADDQPEAAGSQEFAMGGRKPVDGAANADRIVRAASITALD